MSVACFLVFFLFFLPSLEASQVPGQEKKENNQKKTPKVWTNEDLKNLSGAGVSVVGPARPSEKKTEKKAQPGAAYPEELGEMTQEEKDLYDYYKTLSSEKRALLLEPLENDLQEIPDTLERIRSDYFQAASDAERDRLSTERQRLEDRLAQIEREVEILRFLQQGDGAQEQEGEPQEAERSSSSGRETSNRSGSSR